jgi:hypothetical protein
MPFHRFGVGVTGCAVKFITYVTRYSIADYLGDYHLFFWSSIYFLMVSSEICPTDSI